jgi:2-succinyl-5-enolpyruvyl-6-hydroxy-3-cyclohexene-1-carboxylate synthase
MIIQAIVDIAAICAGHRITQAVICPGSRSAPLTLAFSRHQGIKTYVIPDERSAGYVALGLAQSSGKPVAVVTTSGTAAANIYPAVIEAFYQRVPLLVFTADRPPEWIDQQDGQAIRQYNLYERHVLRSFQFPSMTESTDAKWHANRLVNEAIMEAQKGGPVHVNVPIREPFYPETDEQWCYSENVRIIMQRSGTNLSVKEDITELLSHVKEFGKVMLLVGQYRMDYASRSVLQELSDRCGWLIVGDIVSNVHTVSGAITRQELILKKQADHGILAPELLISIGQSVLSKALKSFLRQHQPLQHWHIGEGHTLVDTLMTLTKKVVASPAQFFSQLLQADMHASSGQLKYQQKWFSLQMDVANDSDRLLAKKATGELAAVAEILKHLPTSCDLHLANSMTVRNANLLGLKAHNEVRVWSNRGTSGIDGCTSTAIGHAINEERIQLLLTGDMAFFYDRNALWHHHLTDNLRIVVLNNHGGGIFRLIDGSCNLPELDGYFETTQALSAVNTAKDFDMAYYCTDTIADLNKILPDFLSIKNGKSILEFFSDGKSNQQIYDAIVNGMAK